MKFVPPFAASIIVLGLLALSSLATAQNNEEPAFTARYQIQLEKEGISTTDIQTTSTLGCGSANSSLAASKTCLYQVETKNKVCQIKLENYSSLTENPVKERQIDSTECR